MDGETDEAAEPTTAPEPREQVSAVQLCDYLARARFEETLGRRGYQQDEVRAFLARLTEAVQAEEPLAELVRRNRFTTVRAENGFDVAQVDDFLAAVVDLDPHAEAPKPEVGRSGLLTRLFG